MIYIDAGEEIRKYHNKKLKKKIHVVAAVIWLVFFGFCLGIMPYCAEYANGYRATPGIGGELLIPLIPFLCIPAFNVVCEVIYSITEK